MQLSKSKTLCLYFQLHQPIRLNLPTKLDLETTNLTKLDHKAKFPTESFTQGPSGDNPEYLYGNTAIFDKVVSTSYLPGLTFWLAQVKKLPSFRLTLGLSGTFLEQLEKSTLSEQVLTLIRQLLATGRVEILAETYYHSLASLLDEAEFVRQIQKHTDSLKRLFDYQATCFRNTELIFNPKIGHMVQKLGFPVQMISQPKKLLKVPGIAPSLALLGPIDVSNSNNQSNNLGSISTQFSGKTTNLKLALANFEATMFFFFTHRNDEFKEFFQNYPGDLEVLGTDFEIFGEHNDSHIFEIWNDLLATLEPNWNFATVSDLDSFPQNLETKPRYTNQTLALNPNSSFSLPIYQEVFEESTTSWTNSPQSLVSWLGNSHQNLAFEKLQEIYRKIQDLNQIKPLSTEIWDFFGKLTTSDNFYYMSDLEGNDGLLHAMFNAYPSPKIAFETYLQILEIFAAYLDKLS